MTGNPELQTNRTGRQAPLQRPVPPRQRATWKLYLLILVCIAPVIASYLAYYVFPPSERTNYGTLIEPQRPVPEIASRLIHAPVPALQTGLEAGLRADGLGALKGQWLLLTTDAGACGVACAEKLFFMRQTHVSLGKERERLERVLLVVDEAPLPAAVLAAHPDLVVLQVGREALEEVKALLPVASDAMLADHIFVIDPLHNLMMRFPKAPDPAKTRRDLQKLLKASRIG